MSLPTVSAWALAGGAYRLAARLAGYSALRFETNDTAPGEWSMSISEARLGDRLPANGLITVDWDGSRWGTGRLIGDVYKQTTGAAATRELSGQTGLGSFAGINCWPNPDRNLAGQTSEFALYAGDAESVVRDLVAANYRDHYGLPLRIGLNANQGDTARVRARMSDLLELVQRATRLGGIVVELGLRDTSGVDADLWMDIRTPADLSAHAVLSKRAGTLKGVTFTRNRPAMTHALVGGGGSGATRVWARVSTPDSEAAALEWGEIQQFVDAGEVFDLDELQDRGRAAVDEAMAAAQTFELEASQRWFGRAALGDTVRVELATGASYTGPMKGLRLEVTAGGGPTVTPIVGDPDGGAAGRRMARIVKRARHDIRLLQTTRERTA